jgi:hypothetical protein
VADKGGSFVTVLDLKLSVGTQHTHSHSSTLGACHIHTNIVESRYTFAENFRRNEKAMEAPNTPTSTTALPTRLRRFKDASVEKSCLEAQIEKMIERREILAIRKVERAEKELERIMTNAATARFELKSIRFPTCRGTAKKEEIMRLGPLEFDNSVASENAKPEVISSPPGEGMAVKDPLSHSPCLGSPFSSTSSSNGSSIVLDGPSSISVSSNIRNDAIPAVPLSEDEEEHCDEILSSQAQRYIKLCEEHRSLEKGIEQELDTEERFAIEQVQSAKSSLEAVRKRISDFVANLRKASGEETVIAVPSTIPTISMGGENKE